MNSRPSARRGWAMCDGEGLLAGDRALAAPCFDSKGQVRFSIAIASTRKRLPPSRDKECLPKLLATTQEISDTLGLLGSDWSPQEFTDYTQAAANYSLAAPPAKSARRDSGTPTAEPDGSEIAWPPG